MCCGYVVIKNCCFCQIFRCDTPPGVWGPGPRVRDSPERGPREVDQRARRDQGGRHLESRARHHHQTGRRDQSGWQHRQDLELLRQQLLGAVGEFRANLKHQGWILKKKFPQKSSMAEFC